MPGRMPVALAVLFFLPLRHLRARLPEALAATALAGLRGHHLRGEHRAGQLHGRPGARHAGCRPPSGRVRSPLAWFGATEIAIGLAALSIPPALEALTFAWLAAALPSPFRSVEGRRLPPGERALWVEEGKQSTVGVYTQPMGGRVLYLDGLHQANDSAQIVRLHRRIGLLAMALHPSPQRVLVIGLGGGVTAGAASLVDGATVDVVELSETVVRGAAWFSHVNHDVLRRPNVRLRVDDGRSHLQTTRERYDVITADIIQPIHAGAGSLYSREYFRLARRALADGGLMLQWIGERPRTHYVLIMRTFLDAFPETTLWVGGQLMIGATGPLALDPAAFEAKRSQPGTRRALESIGIRSLADLRALLTAGSDELHAFVGPGPLLTDDRPLVEYHRSLPGDDPIIDLRELTGRRAEPIAARRRRPDPGGP